MKKITFQKLCDNLNVLMAKKRVRYSELARETGITPTTIKRLRNDPASNPTLESLLPLAQFFSINVSQLIGELSIDYEGLTLEQKASPTPVTYVPKLSWEQVRDLTALDYSAVTHWVATEKNMHKKGFALEVKQSDVPELPKGAVILVDPLVTPQCGDYIIVTKTDEWPSIKQFILDDGAVYLKPILNGLSLIPKSEHHKIVGVIREYKMDMSMA